MPMLMLYQGVEPKTEASCLQGHVDTTRARRLSPVNDPAKKQNLEPDLELIFNYLEHHLLSEDQLNE